MNNIMQIEIERIHPHPNNPRKNLGDLTELAESIKAQGILQNLTVIPKDAEEYKKMVSRKRKYVGDYIAIIGHRRHAAAKLAGLESVPCVIAVMDEKTQISTMLLENIQRNDLTPLEQALGFQMMIDLGDTVSVIAEQTGFSVSTINRRLKLTELDQKKLAESFERGGTLSDYAKLEEISDIKRKNEVLNSIGTNNFDWAVKNAVNEEKRKKNKPLLLKILNSFAAEIKPNNTHKHEYISGYNFTDEPEKLKIPKNADKVKYYFCENYNGFSLYKERVDKKPNAKAEEKLKEAARRQRQAKKALKDAFTQAYELRLDFAKSFKTTSKNTDSVNEMVAGVLFDKNAEINESVFKEIYGITEDFRPAWKDGGGETFTEAADRIMRDGSLNANILFRVAYIRLESDTLNCTRYNGFEYDPNKKLNKLYDYLSALGYQMSDDERALLDGTHELYVREGENNG